jgi:hypothetical protein
MVRVSRLVAVFALSPLACVGAIPHDVVAEQASNDHQCPKDRIAVADENTALRTYRLNVCGMERRYRAIESDGIFELVDVTKPPKTPNTSAPTKTALTDK